MKTTLNFAVLTGIVASIGYREPPPNGYTNEASIPVIKNEGEQYGRIYIASYSRSPFKYRT